jgi:hypothetical protein
MMFDRPALPINIDAKAAAEANIAAQCSFSFIKNVRVFLCMLQMLICCQIM